MYKKVYVNIYFVFSDENVLRVYFSFHVIYNIVSLVLKSKTK